MVVLRVFNLSGSVIECNPKERNTSRAAGLIRPRDLQSARGSAALRGRPLRRNLRGTLSHRACDRNDTSIAGIAALSNMYNSCWGGCDTCGELMNDMFVVFLFIAPVARCWQVCNLGWCNEATTRHMALSIHITHRKQVGARESYTVLRCKEITD